ncbi:MAG: hypothetical protein E6J46_02345 [Chloroflexi bacterium]|nr:MAG: hypothetical protein E6J46_02345 [Chloroflexota bacterium]
MPSRPFRLRVHDTLTGRKIVLTPPARGPLTIYVCGVTPYESGHMGHAFTFSIFDVLVRFLEANGVRVKYVQNITDVDDPLLERARTRSRASSPPRPGCIQPATRTRPTPSISTPANTAATAACLTVRGVPCFGGCARRACWERSGRVRSATRSTFRCGGALGPTNRRGRRSSAKGVQAGTSNAQRCRCTTSGRRSTSTAGDATSSSATTSQSARSPSRSRTRSRLRGPGCTRAWSATRAAR